MAVFVKSDFSGGLNRQVDSIKLSANEHSLLINGRIRHGVVTPIKKPRDITNEVGLPIGNMQGCYAASTYMLVFVDGHAFVRNFAVENSAFYKINDLSLSPTAEYIYAVMVPGSSINYQRVLSSSSSPDVPIVSSPVDFTRLIRGSPTAVVCQDGVSQPWLILPNGTSRKAYAYSQWTTEDREYVPIGCQMAYVGAKLYVVSPDKLKLYHSVSGRPLDFIVNIDTTGNKMQTEAEGGADTVSHSVSYEEITAIATLPLEGGPLYVGTKKNSHIVIPSQTSFVFGEPTFSNTYLFPAGALNQFSVVDILGDTAIISHSGLVSFNAVAQLRNEGRNSPFSAKISSLLSNISAHKTAAIVSDNYAYFAVNTIFGYGIVVFDTITRNYVGIDIFPEVGEIKQFCEIDTGTERKLYFITTNNRLYEAFAGDTATCQLYVGDWCSENPLKALQPQKLSIAFVNCIESGSVSVQTFTDRQLSQDGTIERTITATDEPITYPITPPYNLSTDADSQMISFELSRALQGWRCGALITWNVEASLSTVIFEASEHTAYSSYAEQASTYTSYSR